MWTTLKSGVSEFVTTVKDDTLKTVVGRGEADGPDDAASAPSCSERAEPDERATRSRERGACGSSSSGTNSP